MSILTPCFLASRNCESPKNRGVAKNRVYAMYKITKQYSCTCASPGWRSLKIHSHFKWEWNAITTWDRFEITVLLLIEWSLNLKPIAKIVNRQKIRSFNSQKLKMYKTVLVNYKPPNSLKMHSHSQPVNGATTTITIWSWFEITALLIGLSLNSFRFSQINQFLCKFKIEQFLN